MGTRLQVPSVAVAANRARAQPPAATRWRVSQPGDAAEREADRLADQVMESPGRAPAGTNLAASPSPGAGQIHRACKACADDEHGQNGSDTPLHRSTSAPGVGSPPQVTPAIAARVTALPGSGQALPAAAQAYFAPRFGFDFSGVRIHTDAEATMTARQLQARAFTVGRDIVFGAGEYAPHSRPGMRLLAHELAHVVQQAPGVARAAIQRAADDGAAGAAAAADASAAADAPQPQGLIVDDSVAPAGGQMRKAEFLAVLRPAVQQEVEAAFTSPQMRAQVQPMVDARFAAADGEAAAEVERGILQQAPEAAGVRAAADYVPVIAARIRGAADAGGGAPSGGAQGPAVARKAIGAAAPAPIAAPAVRAQLGRGAPIDTGVRARMESGFGLDFSQVRVHTDPGAARLAQRLEAAAFTVGEHVAFGRGEYRPGTTDGDTLLAHELAHVVQQRGAGGGLASGASEHALERDADASAETVIGRLWGGVKRRWPGGGKGPRLASGTRVQRQAVQYRFQQRDFDSCLYCICQSQPGMPERMPDVLPNHEAQCSAGLEVDLSPGSCDSTVERSRRRLGTSPCPQSTHVCQ